MIRGHINLQQIPTTLTDVTQARRQVGNIKFRNEGIEPVRRHSASAA